MNSVLQRGIMYITYELSKILLKKNQAK